MHNLSSFWIHQRINHHLKISLTTLSKIIKSNKRYYKQRQYFQFKHPRRYYHQELGKLQMDIKIIPATDTEILKPVYEIDFIDEQSKLVYAKIIKRQSLDEIMHHTREALSFFKKHRINVKRIRTDNYMTFKKTNFVKNGIFDKYLASCGIIHEFIPLGEPQCNGVTERFHKTIDDEFLSRFHNINNLDELSQKYDEWINFYNYQRYHYFASLNTHAFDTHFMTPIDMVKYTQKLHL